MVKVAAFLLMFFNPLLFADINNVPFLDRIIDVKSILSGFPYTGFKSEYHHKKRFLFMEKTSQGFDVRALTLGSEVIHFSNSTLLARLDEKPNGYWYDEKKNYLYYILDENHNEKYNLFRLNLKTHETKKLTDVPKIEHLRINKEGTEALLSVRLGQGKQEDLCELRSLDLETLKESVLLKGEEGWRFKRNFWNTKTGEVFQFYYRTVDGEVRWYLYYLKLSEPEKGFLAISGRNPVWIDDNNVIFQSFARKLAHYHIPTRTTKHLISFSKPVGRILRIDKKSGPEILVPLMGAKLNELVSVNPETGELSDEKFTFEGKIHPFGSSEDKALLALSSMDVPLKIVEVSFDQESMVIKDSAVMKPENLNKIVQCKTEELYFKTFDKVQYDLDGKRYKGKLPAYLYRPINPLPKDKSLVMVESFYGGTTKFRERYQLLCAAGIHVYSPAPRGSMDFGSRFSDLNNGDRGGGELLDGIFAAKKISKKLRIPSKRVGVFGISHGGYLSLWHLTFPGEVNGVKASFDWGFGISEAGISDVLRQADPKIGGNVAITIKTEVGGDPTDPEIQEKYRKRSPVHFAHNLKAKLLLIHGTADKRVTIIESRSMFEKLKESGKDSLVTYQEFPGEGHDITNPEKYVTWLKFLESVVLADK